MMPSVDTLIRRQYKERNLANGRCAECRSERDPVSKRFCPRHLLKNRLAQRARRQRPAAG